MNIPFFANEEGSDRGYSFSQVPMRSRRDHQQLTDDSKNKLIAAPRAKAPHPAAKGTRGTDGDEQTTTETLQATARRIFPMRAKKKKAPLATKATRITIIPNWFYNCC